MFMKKWKMKYLFPLSFAFIFASCTSAISCSQSLESRLNDLLNNENIINLKINVEGIRKTLNKNNDYKITVKDLFTTNVDNIIIIEESQELISWNQNLNQDDKLSFSINPKIETVIFPSKNIQDQDKTLQYLDIVIDVSSGPYNNKTIVKKLNLNSPDIDNTIQFSTNNYFDWTNTTSINGPEKNQLYKSLKRNIKEYLQRKHIQISETMTIEELNSKLSIKLLNDIDGFNLYQDNLFISFDHKEDKNIYLNIYASKDTIPNEKVITEELSLKMLFNMQEIKGV